MFRINGNLLKYIISISDCWLRWPFTDYKSGILGFRWMCYNAVQQHGGNTSAFAFYVCDFLITDGYLILFSGRSWNDESIYFLKGSWSWTMECGVSYRIVFFDFLGVVCITKGLITNQAWLYCKIYSFIYEVGSRSCTNLLLPTHSFYHYNSFFSVCFFSNDLWNFFLDIRINFHCGRYVEPSIRPDDSRYGENPNRLQRHTQFQVGIDTSESHWDLVTDLTELSKVCWLQILLYSSRSY